MSRRGLRTLVKDANGERRHRSASSTRKSCIPDFTKPDPLLTFKLDDVAFVYGTKWKQRYFKKVGDDYFPLAAQWDVTHKIWRAYLVAAEHGLVGAVLSGRQHERPTGPLCDGCHSVNYNIQTKTVTEWNVGCERCHGPGSEHVRQSDAQRTSSIRRSSTSSAPTTPASSAIRKGSR